MYVIDYAKDSIQFGQAIIVWQNEDGTKEPPRDDCKEFKCLTDIVNKLKELNKDYE